MGALAGEAAEAGLAMLLVLTGLDAAVRAHLLVGP